jgi:hypothetical protein
MKFQFIAAVFLAAEAAFFAFLTPSIKDLAGEKLKKIKGYLRGGEPIGSKLKTKIFNNFSNYLAISIFLRRCTLSVFLLIVLAILGCGFCHQCELNFIKQFNLIKQFDLIKAILLGGFLFYYASKNIIWAIIKILEYHTDKDFTTLDGIISIAKLRRQPITGQGNSFKQTVDFEVMPD